MVLLSPVTVQEIQVKIYKSRVTKVGEVAHLENSLNRENYPKNEDDPKK